MLIVKVSMVGSAKRIKQLHLFGSRTDPEFWKCLTLSKQVRIGGAKKLLVSRLLSYDERMAVARVWISSRKYNASDNIFVGNPVWNISSWHEEKTSIPRPYEINMEHLEFKPSTGMQWPAQSVTVSDSCDNDVFQTIEVVFNAQLLKISSHRNQNDQGAAKFKLLGITTC